MEPTQPSFDPTTGHDNIGHDDDTLVDQRVPNPMPVFTLGWPSSLRFPRSIAGRVAAGVAAVLVLCVVCAFCGSAMSALANGGGASTVKPVVNAVVATATRAPATPTYIPFASPTPAPTDPPTATPNPNDPAIVATYAFVVQSDASPLANDLTTVGNDCGAQLLDLCQSDLQTVIADAQSFQNDLNQTPVPPCLAAANNSLQKALVLIQTASQTVSDGIANNDANLVSEGSRELRQATAYENTATAQIDSAQCN